MVSNLKHQKQQLKQPDNFQKKGLAALRWLLEHQKALFLLLGAAAALVAAVAGWIYFKSMREDSRREELAVIEKAYSDETTALSDEQEKIDKEIEELNKQLSDKKFNPPAAPTPPPAAGATAEAAPAAVGQLAPADAAKKAELEAKKLGLEKSKEGMKADHSKSQVQYAAFFDKYPGHAEGWYAGMRVVQVKVQQKDFAAAKDVATKVAELSKGDRFYQVQSRLTLVGLNEELGKFDDGIAQADELLKTGGDELKPQLLLGKANLLYAKGAKKEALASLDELISKHADSREARKAKSMKVVLQ